VGEEAAARRSARRWLLLVTVYLAFHEMFPRACVRSTTGLQAIDSLEADELRADDPSGVSTATTWWRWGSRCCATCSHLQEALEQAGRGDLEGSIASTASSSSG
jgi:hypothetical protein